MNDEIHAIILKQMDYREKDILFTVLSKEYGKLSFVASGARKLTSKNAGALLPYSYANITFDYHENKSIFRLKTAHTLQLYPMIHKDLLRTSAASLVCSLMDFMSLSLNEDGLAIEQFDLLHTTLQFLEEKKDVHSVVALFICDVLSMFGSAPYVDGCVVCHQDGVSGISVKDGGFVCKKHALIENVPILNKNDLKRFRILCKVTLKRYALIEDEVQGTLQDVEYLVRFAHTYTGFSLETFQFYKQVCELNKIV